MSGLSSKYVLEYAYKRSVGPVIGRFLEALRDGRIEGVRSQSGRVIVPPVEYDENGDATGEAVPLPNSGIVTTWAWVESPRPNHPLQKPFAFALIKIDGADTAMLHVVDAGTSARMKTGMRVTARFRAERKGEIRDLECFAPEAT